MRKGLIGLVSITGATLLNGAASGQCEVTQVFSQGGFGRVSISGDVAVIGDSSAFGSLGAAFVYRRGPGGLTDWKLQATLMAPEPDVGDIFGSSVAVSDDVIVVGAYGADTPDFQSGAAHVFRYDPDSAMWSNETTLTASDGDASDIFGFSVSVDGDLVLIGARDDENEGLNQSGSAYIFRFDPDTSAWIEEAKLTDPNAEEDDLFGVSVSIRGDVALVGAHGNDGLHGAAYVFRYNPDRPGDWLLETEIPSDGVGQDWFGFSVSLSDGVAIVGAYRDNSTDKGNDAGSAYIFRFDPDTSGWIEEQKITASDAAPLDFFGWSVSISEDGNAVLVGATSDDDLGSKSGSAYVFRYTPETRPPWQETTKLLASDGGPFDLLGSSVSISGDIAMIKGGGKGYIFAGMSGLDCNENGKPDSCDIFDGTSDDQDANGVPDECERPGIPGDINGDGTVGAADLLILLSSWGPCGDCDECSVDLNGDCVVGAADLLILLENWG
ncbi:MAG: dockerin type I domain-containing protein [Phycisphaerales bacterium]